MPKAVCVCYTSQRDAVNVKEVIDVVNEGEKQAGWPRGKLTRLKATQCTYTHKPPSVLTLTNKLIRQHGRSVSESMVHQNHQKNEEDTVAR